MKALGGSPPRFFVWRSLPEDIKKSDYNTNNHHDRDPYWIDEDSDTLIVDRDWWFKQVPYVAMKLLIWRGVDCVIGKVQIPHEDQLDPRLVQVYQAFQEAYEMQNWYDGPCVHFIVEKPRDLEWDALLCKVESLNLDPEKRWFVRTGCTSGKNSVPVYPCKGAKEIVNRLLENPEIEVREWSNSQKESHVFLIPWNDKIDARNEFRVFVANQQVTCLSPQRFWECHNYSEEELESVEVAILKLSASPFKYNFCVIDLWIDFETSEPHIIEYNCFGDHSGAGSSFFKWIEDHDLLYGVDQDAPIEIRFVSAIKMDK